METITIEAQHRQEYGKKVTRKLRSRGHVPAIIYGKAKPVAFSASAVDFTPLLRTQDLLLANIKLGDNQYSCVVKEMQFDVVKDHLIHVDFLELSEKKKIIVSLPIKLVGQAAGVKVGGKLISKLKKLKVKVFPEHLKPYIEVNIDKLELNQNIRVGDITVDNMEIMNNNRIPIASVVMTRQLRQEEAASEKEAAKVKGK